MPALAVWQKARKSYVQAMADQLDSRKHEYGFSMLKYVYSSAYRLEFALNDPNGIDPNEVEWCISNLEHHVQGLREWQLMKSKHERERNATTRYRP